jgi:hypothetical protein
LPPPTLAESSAASTATATADVLAECDALLADADLLLLDGPAPQPKQQAAAAATTAVLAECDALLADADLLLSVDVDTPAAGGQGRARAAAAAPPPAAAASAVLAECNAVLADADSLLLMQASDDGDAELQGASHTALPAAAAAVEAPAPAAPAVAEAEAAAPPAPAAAAAGSSVDELDSLLQDLLAPQAADSEAAAGVSKRGGLEHTAVSAEVPPQLQQQQQQQQQQDIGDSEQQQHAGACSVQDAAAAADADEGDADLLHDMAEVLEDGAGLAAETQPPPAATPCAAQLDGWAAGSSSSSGGAVLEQQQQWAGSMGQLSSSEARMGSQAASSSSGVSTSTAGAKHWGVGSTAGAAAGIGGSVPPHELALQRAWEHEEALVHGDLVDEPSQPAGTDADSSSGSTKQQGKRRRRLVPLPRLQGLLSDALADWNPAGRPDASGTAMIGGGVLLRLESLAGLFAVGAAGVDWTQVLASAMAPHGQPQVC